MAIEERTLTISDEAPRPEEEALAVEAMGFDSPPPPEPTPVFPGPARPMPSDGTGDAEPMENKTEDKGPRAWLESNDANDFTPFFLTEMKRIKPPHACVGNRSEIERSLGQHKKLNGYVSKALRSDYDDKLDVKGIDGLRSKLEHGIDQLEQMLEALDDLKRNKKKMRRRRASDDSLCESCAAPLWHDPDLDLPVCVSCIESRDGSITKEATVAKVQYFATAFERAITGALVNGKVSGGRNLDELYAKAKEQYSITPREELAIFQILSDMGYPTFKDRLRIAGGDEDPRSTVGDGEWSTMYYA